MSSRRDPSARKLHLEPLECREAPSGTPWLTENFDTTPPGALPATWTQWDSSTGASIAVAAGTGVAGSRSLAVSASLSQAAAHAWYNTQAGADVEVSASILLNSLIPAQVLARGSALNTATPTYYALSLTRGLQMQLLRVVNGTTTVIGQINSAGWFSDQWVRATLQTSGSTLRAQLVRTDNGQYLNAAGQWQTAQTWALQVTDTAIAQAGLIGVARPASYTGTIQFDDFTAANPTAASTPVAVSTSAAWGVAESFDSTGVGTLPAGWTQYSSTGSPAFAVAAGTALSGANGLTATANLSSLSARAWMQTAVPADVQVTAAVLVNSLIPAQVLARGSALNTATPTYYALSLVRGMQVQLLRVVNGATTVLGQLSSTGWFSGPWVRATLSVAGSTLRAQIYRTDTSQYLNAAGQWQAAQAWALSVTDTVITQAGQVGLGRPASYTGSLVFDDFSAQPAATGLPSVALTLPGGTLSGVVTVQADVTSANAIAHVDFLLDNVVRFSTTTAPYRWTFDTSTASNASHQLTVIAYDAAGNVAQASRTITTQNDTVLPRPVIPQHYPNIRIAELAYNGLTFGPTEDSLLASSVDLVVADPIYAAHIHSVAPATPQAIYTNVSNLYGTLLTNWLTYADANGLSRESAFYHVTTATPFNGDSPASQPVTWFWAAFRGATTLTDVTARTHGSGGVTFGNNGESLYLGYTDPFREINVNLNTPAQLGWSAVLEYASAVDAAGNPTAWRTLTTISNGTAGMTHSGRITFDPPADWKTASVGGSARLFYVRFRTVNGGLTPTATSILGRDYVNANGSTQGVIPVFDTAADLNHDGYLSDAEYANRAPGKDARFLYESRLVYPNYGQMRFLANPTSLGYRGFAADSATRLLAANPLASALFVDNSGGNFPVTGVSLAESVATYTSDYANLLNSVGRAIAPRWIIANTAGGGTSADTVIQHTQAYFDEFEIRPLAHTYLQFQDVAADVARRAALTSPAPYAILDSLPAGGSPTDPRTQLATLAYYYLLADPATTFLDFFGGTAPNTSWVNHWVAAAAYNIGAPTGTWSQFASGTDPLNPALTYRVYQRGFANALVLYKPLSTDPTETQVGSLTSATTHALNGTYRPLLADGTLGAPVTSVTLRNGEGAILVRV
jgi:hypothetical protein